MIFGLVLKKAVENVLIRVHQPSLIELRHGKMVRGFEGSSDKSIGIFEKGARDISWDARKLEGWNFCNINASNLIASQLSGFQAYIFIESWSMGISELKRPHLNLPLRGEEMAVHH